MPLPRPPSSRTQREDFPEEANENNVEAIEPPAKRRRVFLQTMGQQLREVGQRDDGETGSSHTPNSTSQGGRQVQIQTPESDAVPGEDDRLPFGATMSASRPLWHPGEVQTSDINENNDFTFEDLIAWTRSYFDHWHPAYPFLHAPSILEHFDHVVDHGISDVTSLSDHQLTILRSIISISLADTRQTGFAMKPVPPHLVFKSLNHAIQSVQCVLMDETSMLSLQAVVGVQLFLISMLRYNAASRLEGLAVRMAYHLGLHRCPMQSTTMPRQEAELRQRMFWSMYCIDRYICIRLGIPLAFRDAEVNVCLPAVELHGDGSDEQNHDTRGDSRLDLLGFLARHARIRGSISELRNRSVSNRRTEIDEAVVIGAELTKWWNDVDEYLDTKSSHSMPIHKYHQVTLAILRQESVIALNKHTLATSLKSSAYDAALQNCIGASRSIISTLHNALTAGDLVLLGANEAPTNSGLLWPSFTWAIWMSAFLVIYAANEDQISHDVAIRLSERALGVLKHLTLRESLWPNACAAAIRDLKSQLVEQRNRSKHTHAQHNPNIAKPAQRGTNASLELNPLQNHGDSELLSASNRSSKQVRQNSVGGQETQPTQDMYHGNHFHQNEEPPRNSARTHENIAPSFPYQNHSSGNFPNASPSPFTSRLNWMFSEGIPDFGEGSGYAYRMGGQLQPELQLPNQDGSDFVYGLDTPFWMRDGQWMGGSG